MCVCAHTSSILLAAHTVRIAFFESRREYNTFVFRSRSRNYTFFMYSIHSSLSTLVILSYFRFFSSPSLSLTHYARLPINVNIICVYLTYTWGDYYNDILCDCNIIIYNIILIVGITVRCQCIGTATMGG